jgi:hypothetical protein
VDSLSWKCLVLCEGYDAKIVRVASRVVRVGYDCKVGICTMKKLLEGRWGMCTVAIDDPKK